jgi:type II secretory pathway pseudopilin PulG
MLNKQGQVWIETVLYIVISLVLIGIVLSFVMPKINEAKERSVVEQSLQALSSFDEKINEVLVASGNVRSMDFTIKKGDLIINSAENKLIFSLNDMEKPYSEPGINIKNGRIDIHSWQANKGYNVNLTIKYNVNISYRGSEEYKKFTPASTPYSFSITNQGNNIIIAER